MYDKLILATFLFVLGQAITWFSSYSQFVWEWAAERPITIALITAIPAALCFIYGIRFAYEYFQLWVGSKILHIFAFISCYAYAFLVFYE